MTNDKRFVMYFFVPHIIQRDQDVLLMWCLLPLCELCLHGLFMLLHLFIIIRPPGTVVPGRPYVLPQFFFFSTRDLRGPWADLRKNFATCSEACL